MSTSSESRAEYDSGTESSISFDEIFKSSLEKGMWYVNDASNGHYRRSQDLAKVSTSLFLDFQSAIIQFIENSLENMGRIYHGHLRPTPEGEKVEDKLFVEQTRLQEHYFDIVYNIIKPIFVEKGIFTYDPDEFDNEKDQLFEMIAISCLSGEYNFSYYIYNFEYTIKVVTSYYKEKETLTDEDVRQYLKFMENYIQFILYLSGNIRTNTEDFNKYDPNRHKVYILNTRSVDYLIYSQFQYNIDFYYNESAKIINIKCKTVCHTDFDFDDDCDNTMRFTSIHNSPVEILI